MTGQRGFTMVEMLCALAILGLVLGVSVRILGGSANAAGATRSAGQALALAQGHLAILESLDAPAPLDRSGIENGLRWRDRIRPATEAPFTRAAAAHLAAWRLDSEAQAPDGRIVRLSSVRLTAP